LTTFNLACIHGWMMHMNLRVVPAFAFTLKVILAPLFGAVIPESPGLSRFGGVFWPTPFSRYWNVGGAGLLGSAPCALPSVLQILQLLSLLCRLRKVLLPYDAEGVRSILRLVQNDGDNATGTHRVEVLAPAHPILDVPVGLELDAGLLLDGQLLGSRGTLRGDRDACSADGNSAAE